LQLWHLIALGVWSGVVSGFDMPSRSAFVVGLVDSKADLPAAIALNSTLMNATRMIGPALAGFIVASAGEGMCFLINALSYIAVIAALFFIRGDFNPPKAAKTASVRAEMVDGLKYVWDTIPLRALILMMAFYCLGAMAYASIMPVFVKEIHGDAKTLGFLMSSSAVGSLVGAILLANRKQVLGLGGWIAGAAFAFSAALLVFARITSFWPAVAVLVFMGFCMMIQIAGTNTLIQTLVHDGKRGRVMSLFSMAFMGTAPIGSLICGALINRYGFGWTISGCAAYCALVATIWALYLPRLRVSSRPLYIEKGLLIAEEEVSKME
jgi:MFS family permease